MLLNPFIGAHARALIAELDRLSGRIFQGECLLLPDEAWAEQVRVELWALVHGKVSTVESLRELCNELRSTEAFLYDNNPTIRDLKTVVPGYQRVAEKFRELTSMRWVVATKKYKKGMDPNPSEDWKTWAHGLIEVDKRLLEEFRAILNEAETIILNTAIPDFVDRFRLSYLTNDLMRAGIPTAGLRSPQSAPSPESDSVPCEYFKLHNGQFLRMTLAKGARLTEEQRESAYRMILDHMKESEQQGGILDSLGNKLRRAGHGTSRPGFRKIACLT